MPKLEIRVGVPPTTQVFMAWRFIKQRDNLTFKLPKHIHPAASFDLEVMK
jgi:hypothetical protein